MVAAENSLQLLNKVLQYVDAQEKKSALIKEYEHKNNEASSLQKQYNMQMSDSEVITEFKRVAKLMTGKLVAAYQLQFDAEEKNFQEVLREAKTLVKEAKDFISEYGTKLPKLEAKYAQLDKEYKLCCSKLTSAEIDIVRDSRKTSENPFNDDVFRYFNWIKDYVSKIPEEYLHIKVAGYGMSKSRFLNDCTPKYTRGGGIYHEVIEITTSFPDGFMGRMAEKRHAKNVESMKGVVWSYNSSFEKFCAAELFFSIFNNNNISALTKEIEQSKNNLVKYKGLLPRYEQDVKDVQRIYDDFLALGDSRKYIEAGYCKPLTQAELDRVKSQVIKEAASKLQIQPDDLLDYIAKSSSNEPYGKFVDACAEERARLYIELRNRKVKNSDKLVEEQRRKLEEIKFPDLDASFRKMSKESPLYVQAGFPRNMNEDEVGNVMDAIIKDASINYSLRMYPTGGCFHIPGSGGKKCVNEKGEYLWAPSYCMISAHAKTAPNIILAHDKATVVDAVKALNRVLVNVLLTVPPRKLRLRIIDMAATNMASLITTRLHPSLYNNEVVMNERELRAVVEEWQARTKRIMQKCDNLADYNDKNSTWLEPYEIAVVLGYPQGLSPAAEDMLRPYIQNGCKSGISFIFVQNVDMQVSHGQNILLEKDVFKTVVPYVPFGKYYPLEHTPIADQPQLLEAVFEYLNTEAGKKEEKPVARQDADKLVGAAYQPDTSSQIRVAVGDDNGHPVYFELDTVSHLHAFILGQSGTGKSRFLHNIIGNVMLSHSPQNVEFYLMDLKLGGVEFNVYKDEKHVRALLVDNNDRQITLEVLRDLARRMEERNKQFAEIGVRNLEAYNQKAETPMPQLVLVVDECQMLFNERPDNTERELRSILSLIAKQGRSQGVHMILSTQTLMNSTIPIDELQGAGLTDFYLLNCDSRDSEKLVKNSSGITGTLQTGEIYYHHHQHAVPDVQFRAFYVDDAQQEKILAGASEKSAELEGVPQYYFSGKMQALLSDSVLDSMQRRSRRALCASLGMGIDLKQDPVNISLNEEQGENVLLFGMNQQQQVMRTATEIFLSTLYSARAAGRDTDFVVIDCNSSDDDTPYQNIFDVLEDKGIIRQVFGRQRGDLLVQLGEDVRANKANETVILIMGQEKWRELRNDKELETRQSDEQATVGGPSFLGGMSFGAGRSAQKTYRTELQYLLENGSEQGVHFILQVDKPQNLLGGQNISQQFVKKLFRHWIMLRSASEAALALRLRDDIRLETLSDDLDRLRAIYYSDDTDTYHMITPYRYTTIEENNRFISR